jgi:hypothetical protein
MVEAADLAAPQKWGALRPAAACVLARALDGAADPETRAALLACAGAAVEALARHVPSESLQAAGALALARRVGARRIVGLPGRTAWTRALLRRAAAEGLRTLDAQAVFISDRPRYLPSAAADYAAMTEDQAALYARCFGVAPGQAVHVVGSLILDRRRRAVAGLDHAAARRALGLPAEGRIALLAAQKGLGRSGERALDIALQAAAGWTGRTLLIRPHPQEDPAAAAAMRARAEASGASARLVGDAPLYTLIRASDAVLTQFSNVGLEAAALDRPVVAIRPPDERYAIDLAAMGVAVEAGDAATLTRRLDAFERGDPEAQAHLAARAAYLARNAGLGAGGAAARIAALLEG